MATVTPSVVSSATIEAAAAGNPALRSMLQQLATAANTQATKTNTSSKGAPNQSTATIGYHNPYYTVTFTDPGGASAASLTQAAQQAAAASLGANPVQSVVYHQVQAATSILFDAGSNLVTYGGDTGSLQSQFTIGDLAIERQWYFRIRTSFDGYVWNQWKIINNGNATAVNPNAVTVRSITGGSFAGITLLGRQVVGFGVGNLPNGGLVESANGVLLANTIGVATPAGYTDTGFEAVGTLACSINGLGAVDVQYGDLSGEQTWPGTANFLTFGWVAAGAQNLTSQVLGDGGRWVVMTLPGGSRVAIGQGTIANGGTFAVPDGFSLANSMGVCTPAVVGPTEHPAYGVSQATVVNGLCTLHWADSTGNVWNSTANWFAIAWEATLSSRLVDVTDGKYLRLPTVSGDVMIGVGATQNGGYMPLPPGYTYPNCIAFSTPAGFDNVLPYAMHGVQLVQIDAGLSTSTGIVNCLYGTVTGSRPGKAAWFTVAWL